MPRAPLLTAFLTALLVVAIVVLELTPQWGFHSGTRLVALLDHVLAYGLLMLPAALLRPGWLHALWPLAATFAGLMEALQPAVQWRGALSHWLAACFGILIVTLSCWLVMGIMELVKAGKDRDW
jgi:hypothetical protein